MGLCPGQKCWKFNNDWYDKHGNRIKKCYYSPKCWRGQVDELWYMVKMGIKYRLGLWPKKE